MKGTSGLALALALALPLAIGCKKDKKTDDTTQTGSGTAVTGSGTGMAGSGTGGMAGSGTGMAGSGTGGMAGSGSAADTLMSKKGGNCPNLVATSTTKVTVDEKTWVAAVEITAADKNAIATIQARTKAWKDRNPASATNVHDSKGGKGGDDGICAVAAPGLAVAEAKDLKDGVSISLKLDEATAKADDAAKRAAFGELQARADKGAQWMKDNLKDAPGGQGGTGDGGGDHGRDHSGKGDAKGKDDKGGTGGGAGTGGGNQDGKGGGGGGGSGSATK